MERLRNWIEIELKKRRWKPADLAHAVGVGTSTISKTLNGNTEPKPRLITDIAKVLDSTPEKLYRLAGLLPEVDESNTTLQEIKEIANNLTPQQRREAANYLLYLLQKQRRDNQEASDEG
jgi:transcriptional regulator with XRE-family HTH domain